MARKKSQRQPKTAIYVFWEGESEAAYSKALKKLFVDKAVIKPHREKGTFDTAMAFYRGNRTFQNELPEYDELWFFFDTEISKANQWKHNMDCLTAIKKARKKSPIKIRMLMTTGCIEYWLLLHYERVRPTIAIATDKERVLKDVQKHVPSYRKGDQETTDEIARHYTEAVNNGKWTMECLKREGMPEGDERDSWLFQGTRTFTTVHEALEMLMAL